MAGRGERKEKGKRKREGEREKEGEEEEEKEGSKGPQCATNVLAWAPPAQLLEPLAATEDGQALESAGVLPAPHHAVPAELPTAQLFLNIYILLSFFHLWPLPCLKLSLEDGVFMCCAREAVLQGTASQRLMDTRTYPHLSAAFPHGTGMIFLSIIKKGQAVRR